MRVALLLLAATLSRGVVIHLDCDAGVDSNDGTSPTTAVRSITRAQALVRGRASGPATVLVRGTCGAARFTAADGGHDEASRVTYAAAPDATAAISGGVPVPASWLAPVTDAAVLAQLPSDAARAAVRVLDLGAHAELIPDAGALVCKPYMGGEASILPGNLVASGLEFFAAGDPTTGGGFSPLALARYPNRAVAPQQWSHGTVDGYTITPDAATAARLPLWAQQMREDPGSVYAHYLGGLEWDDAHHQVENITLPAPPPPPPAGGCGVGNTSCLCFESGFDYDGNDLQSPVPAPSQAACCAICHATAGCKFYSFCDNGACAGGPTMCYLKTSNAGRIPYPNRVSGPSAPAASAGTITLTPCPSHYAEPGFDTLDNKGTYYSYNLLSELDTEGEYYINRTARLLYVWLPASPASPYWSIAPWSSPVEASERAPNGAAVRAAAGAVAASARDDPIVGIVSVNDTLLDLNGASFLTFDGVTVSAGRNVGIRAFNTTGIIFTNGVIENVGNMAANATGGSNLLIDASVVRHAGNGAIFFYAGNRSTLTGSNHSVHNSSVSYSNRYMFCYVPMVALADCGNRVLASELFGGPHQGVFLSGNLHELRNSSLHHLVQAMSDSGAVYTGRDWTYQGSVIDGNSFRHINSLDGGDTSTLYLDDEVSGLTMTNNYFEDVSRALELGGGRDNLFARNVINGTTSNVAISFDNRGEGWAKAGCTPPNGELVLFLARVPYTSALWAASFPSLATILSDEPCVPRHNAIINNSYCNLVKGFISVDNATVTSWGSTMWGNQEGCPSPPA